MTLFDHVGGEEVLEAAVDGFYERMLADPLLSDWFSRIDIGQLKLHQRAFLAVALGGPEHYDGRSMRVAHAGLSITNDMFTRTLDHFADALTEQGVDEAIVRQASRRIEFLRAAIVESR